MQVTGVNIRIDSPSTPTGIYGTLALISICFVVSTLSPVACLPRTGVLFRPFMVGSSAVNGPGVSPGARWFGRRAANPGRRRWRRRGARVRGNHPLRGDDGALPGGQARPV